MSSPNSTAGRTVRHFPEAIRLAGRFCPYYWPLTGLLSAQSATERSGTASRGQRPGAQSPPARGCRYSEDRRCDRRISTSAAPSPAVRPPNTAVSQIWDGLGASKSAGMESMSAEAASPNPRSSPASTRFDFSLMVTASLAHGWKLLTLTLRVGICQSHATAAQL